MNEKADQRGLILEHRKLYIRYARHMHMRIKNGYSKEDIKAKKMRIRMEELEQQLEMCREKLIGMILDEYLSGY